ncbi:MAG: cysteine desulfurase family protein [Cytophagales bacterium]|nr:cysteine desulfurase family protein [Cytophagales bacterium]
MKIIPSTFAYDMQIYLDHAATTPLHPMAKAAMEPYYDIMYGNPSSIHRHGREAKAAVEKSRKSIATILGTTASQIFFTSGATESTNMALIQSIYMYGIKHVLTSSLEHHAVMHPLQQLERQSMIQIHYVSHDKHGNIDLNDLAEFVKNNNNTLVAVMHANNEIGNINPVHEIAQICKQHQAIYFCDTVQTVGCYPIDLQKFKADFITGSAHKFYGPKGVGFIYVSEDIKIKPYLTGGAQERNMRAGTENVAGIVGMCKALEISVSGMTENTKNISKLKNQLIAGLSQLSDIQYNGMSNVIDKSHYKILNVSFPQSETTDMLVFNLDIEKISVSGGSACNSGALGASHVLEAINPSSERPAVRFSLGIYNTLAEIDHTISTIARLMND